MFDDRAGAPDRFAAPARGHRGLADPFEAVVGVDPDQDISSETSCFPSAETIRRSGFSGIRTATASIRAICIGVPLGEASCGRVWLHIPYTIGVHAWTRSTIMFQAGVARTTLTPFWGVELTGWGYYIERRWQRVHDDLNATALAFDDGERQAIVVALDLMVIDEPFTRRTRERIGAETGLHPGSILLTCSHSHNAPAAGGLLGVGECDPAYEDWASRQAATAAILAWRQREPATARCGHATVEGITYNRTRPEGLVDPRLTTLQIERQGGSTLATVVNFGAHPTVTTKLRPWDVSRDVPGEVCDLLESAFGQPALYIQGACGDVNFLGEFTTPELCREPARRLAACCPRLLEAGRTDGRSAWSRPRARSRSCQPGAGPARSWSTTGARPSAGSPAATWTSRAGARRSAAR